MRIHTYGAEHAPVIIMLPGSFCNADTMANLIAELKEESGLFLFQRGVCLAFLP